MLKTLRITSFVLAGAAALGVLVLAVFGLRGSAEIKAFLNEPGVVSRLKGQAQTAVQSDDQTSPLVTQAKAFALRIDPPPPPPPPPGTEEPQPAQPQIPRPVPVTTSVRFELLATAVYADAPEQSLALLKPATGLTKWYRQGDTVGHFEIGDIRQGSITLLKDGAVSSELTAPSARPPFKPLLKSDAAGWEAASASSFSASVASYTPPAASSPMPSGPTEVAPPSDPSAMPAGVTRSIRARQSAVRTAPQATPLPQPETREPTPEESKQQLDETITSIKSIMNETRQDATEEERKQEMESWTQLLQVLEQEKTSLQEGKPNNEK